MLCGFISNHYEILLCENCFMFTKNHKCLLNIQITNCLSEQSQLNFSDTYFDTRRFVKTRNMLKVSEDSNSRIFPDLEDVHMFQSERCVGNVDAVNGQHFIKK